MPEADLPASVVVCTRDRRGPLQDCLASLDRQSAAPGVFEVVVVDSASRDGTAGLLRHWAEGRRDRVTTSLPRPGLSAARNAGLALARGEVVLFLDDDAVAEEDWVSAHLAAHREPDLVGGSDRVVAAVGGPIRLAFPDGRPPWLTPALEHWWSALDHGGDLRAFPAGAWPYGANMSVHHGLAAAAGGFAEALGRRAGSLLSNEEADLVLRIADRGGVVWQPGAVVHHRITRERLTRRWLLRRAWAQGPSNVRMEARLALLPPGGARQAAREQARLALHGPPGMGFPRSAPAALDQAGRRLVHAAAALGWWRELRRAAAAPTA